jgi:HEAT repeat protein
MFGLPPLPRTVEAALRDAEHPDVRVRLSALRDLVRHVRTDARERVTLALIALLRSDAHAEVRAEAAVALADADANGSRAALLAALEDPMLRVRQMALLALGELGQPGDRALADRLAQALSAPEAALRFQALIACERLVPERAAALIEAALADADDEVRAMALRLARRRWPAADAPPDLVRLARASLGDPAASVRASAALWLAPLGDARAAQVLVGVVKGDVPIESGGELEEAIEVAGELRLEAARPGLERRAFGLLQRTSPLAWHARVALARLGDERARRAILRGLRAWSRDARTLAVVAAGRAGLGEASPRIREFSGDARRAEPEAVAEALALLDPRAD